MTKTENLLRQGIVLELLTLGWNVIGFIVVLLAAIEAHSIALAGFGLDSLIEIGASTVVLWQLQGGEQERERKAFRLIGAAFISLATYVLIQSVRVLRAQAHPPYTSVLGLTWLAFTVVVMLTLAAGKAKVGAKLNNAVLQTEARVTVIDAGLAASVLVGIGLNAAFGLWWADPVLALVIVFYGFKEGVHAWDEGRAPNTTTATARLKEFARAFKKELKVYRLILNDPNTPITAKIFLSLAVGYVVMPFDLIPDFIPVLGQLDDLIIVPGLVWIALKFTPRAVVLKCRQQVEGETTIQMSL
jgi:uncharacterized membrane protein YkvA (DUF1232 family)